MKATIILCAALVGGLVCSCTTYVDPSFDPDPVTTTTTTSESTYVPGVGEVTERTTTRTYD